MESARSLRLILAPSVLIGALLLGKWIDGSLINDLARLEGKGLLAVIAGIVTASVIPVGFVIGKVTQSILQRCAEWFGLGNFERHDLLLGEGAIREVCTTLGITMPESGTDRLNAVRTFIYSERWVPARVASYIDRLWDASMAYAQSILALIVAAFLGPCVGMVCFTRWWHSGWLFLV